MKQAIAYYRVSTNRQGKSGLGLEAQQIAVKNYCKFHEYNLIQEVIEVKSTRKCRIRLEEALETCKKTNTTLMVARLDRLGRDVEQIARIANSKVDIVVTDNPHADRFTIHILAAVAEDQRRRISENTKNALQAAKKRGKILGKNGKVLAKANKKAANDFAHKLSPLLAKLKKKGFTSFRAISEELNRRGTPTFRKVGRWHPSTVFFLMKRLK